MKGKIYLLLPPLFWGLYVYGFPFYQNILSINIVDDLRGRHLGVSVAHCAGHGVHVVLDEWGGSCELQLGHWVVDVGADIFVPVVEARVVDQAGVVAALPL